MVEQPRNDKTLVERLRTNYAAARISEYYDAGSTLYEAAQRINELEFEIEVTRNILNSEPDIIFHHATRGDAYSIMAVNHFSPEHGPTNATDNQKIRGQISEYTIQSATPIKHGDLLVFYINKDPAIGGGWARPIAEFLDGRFIRLAVGDE